jgi:hypothetical protein
VRTHDEAQAVLAINGCGTQRGTDCRDFGLGIDQPFVEESKIAVETCYAVRIDTAQISRSENVGGLRGIIFGNAEVEKDPSTEFAQGIDVIILGLDGGHAGPFFARISLRKRGTFAEFATSILAWGRTIGQTIRGVKLRARRKKLREH